MRNEGFAIPVLFTWRIARAGYQWIDVKGRRSLCPVDARRPDWLNMFDRYERSYLPLKERTGLFREFAALEPSERGVLPFANQFGLLQAEDNLELDSEFGPVFAHGEALELWHGEIKALRLATDIWDRVATGSRHDLVELKTKVAALKFPLALQRDLHLDDEDPAAAALSAIQRITDPRLREHVEARLLFRGNERRLQVSLMPRNLLGALWLQFAAAVDGLKNFTKCHQCGVPFELSRAPRTGKRSDAKFCSARCRVALYRGRIEEARRMKTAGFSARQIARRLSAQPGTVRGWLKAVERERIKR